MATTTEYLRPIFHFSTILPADGKVVCDQDEATPGQMSVAKLKDHLVKLTPAHWERPIFIQITNKNLKRPGVRKGDMLIWNPQTRELFKCQRVEG